MIKIIKDNCVDNIFFENFQIPLMYKKLVLDISVLIFTHTETLSIILIQSFATH